MGVVCSIDRRTKIQIYLNTQFPKKQTYPFIFNMNYIACII